MEGQKAALGCKLAPLIPKGTKVKDVRQRKWIIGKPIGSGAFGAIYLARFAGGEEEYVVKVEPHSNGPLWVEMHAFLRVGLDVHRVEWCPKNGKPQGWVGIPNYYGSGSFKLKDEKLRFLVMSRLGSDIQKFFQSGEKPIPLTTALNIGIQVIDSLEYIHSRNYTHNDIKAQNVLLGFGQDQHTVYLVDFGLACKYRDSAGFHRDSTPDERKAHEGTLEYTSRDAHTGAHSRRGDLETLGYNLVHWICGYLPWTKYEDPEQVQSQKIGFMFNIPGFLGRCFKPRPHPPVLEDYLVYVNSLEFEEDPDYSKLRKILAKAMEKEGCEPYSPLVFSNKKRVEREESSDEEDFGQEEESRATRSQDDDSRFAPFSWEQVLSLDPESIIRQASRSSEDQEDTVDPIKTAAFEQSQEDSLTNPTPEMRRLMDIRDQLEMARQKLSWKEQYAEFNQRNAALKAKFANMDLTPSDLTPAMEEVIARRAERMASGVSSPITPEPSDDELEDLEVRTVLQNKTRARRKKSESTTPSHKAANSRSTTPKSRPVTPRTSRRGSSTPGSRPTSTTPKSKPGSRVPSPGICERITRSRTSSRASSPDSPTLARITRSRSETTSPVEDTPKPRMRTRDRDKTADDEMDQGISIPSNNCEDSLQSGEFKLPSNSCGKVTCQICGKRLNLRSLQRHIDNIHADMDDADAGTKRMLSASPKTPILRQKRVRNHYTPLPNQEQEIMPRCRGTGIRENLPMLENPQYMNDENTPNSKTQEPVDSCPMCMIKLPLSRIQQHYDDVHSPARKITRQIKLPTARIPVHVSTDSPLKIRNVDSPAKNDENEENSKPMISVSESVKLRRELNF